MAGVGAAATAGPGGAQALRIAIVGINYAPEEIGIGRYSTDMATGLAARGHTVSMVAGQPYYPQWQVLPAYKGQGWTTGMERGVSVTRCPHYVPSSPSGLRRVLHLLSFTLSALKPAIALALAPRDRRPQVVMCIAPSLLSVPVAWLAARLSGARLWLHVQDFEVEAAAATGLMDGRLLGRLAGWVERRLIGLADVASSISPQMCAKLAQKGMSPDRVVEIRNWADGRLAAIDTHESLYRQEWGVGDRQVCLYSGNIANKQGIDILIEVARRLQHRRDIMFVICGEGPNRAALQDLARGLDTVMFQNLQPLDRMQDLLGLASIHLLPQIPGAADLVLPSKLTNMLASGRPVVATASPGTGLYEEVEGCGINVEPGDAAALARAVETLIDAPALRAEMGKLASARAVERWSIRRIIDRLEAALNSVATGQPLDPGRRKKLA